jgi:glycosyltransferase involved in cell wall biosynthesis
VRIAIDATSVPVQPAGAGIYAIELVRGLSERGRHDGYALFARGAWAPGIVGERKNWRIERVGAGSRAARTAWQQARLPGRLSALGIDVLHSTHHTLPLRPVRARRVVTIHDVTFFRIPQRYPPARRIYMQTVTRLAAKVADALIVPSKTVRDDVVATLAVAPEHVHVTYEAASSAYSPVDPEAARAVACRYGMDGAYVLSVGSLEPGKNRGRLIRALRALRDEGIECSLLVAGQPAWDYERDYALVSDLGMADRVRFAGYVPQADLPALQSAAIAFAFPSLYEGFGLPVLEAMACGAPVLTSNVSATAEVAGDAALLVDPLSVASIKEGLRAVITDDALRRKMASAGLARAAEFRWRQTADETHAVYERVMDNRTV